MIFVFGFYKKKIKMTLHKKNALSHWFETDKQCVHYNFRLMANLHITGEKDSSYVTTHMQRKRHTQPYTKECTHITKPHICIYKKLA